MNRNEIKLRQQRRHTLRTRQGRDRRGVLLLVVLSMLVLFLLLGTTFLITSGQYRTASKIVEQKNRSTFQPADLLERALMQLVRDTNNTTSVVRYHSLLRDLYGVDGFTGRVYAATSTLQDPSNNAVDYETAPRYAGVDPTDPITTGNNLGRGTTQGQVVELYVLDVEDRSLVAQSTLADTNAVGLDFDGQGLPIEHELSSLDGYYDGALLTMLDGPCRGQSVRILNYDSLYRSQGDPPGINTPNDPTDDVVNVLGRFRIMVPSRTDGLPPQLDALPSDGTRTALTDFVESATLGHRFIVNGRPFNGTGVGYNPLALSSDRADAPMPRLSTLEAMQMFGTTIWYGMEHALSPNATNYLEVANTALSPQFGADPWAPPTAAGIYTNNAFLPLTRDFAASSTADYDPRTSPLYRTFAGPGDTDESYDAPDAQNMALASQALEPRSRGRVVNANGVSLDPDAFYQGGGGTPSYIDLDGVTIPSFHRPALANFWFHRLWRSSWLQGIVGDSNERVRAILEPFDANGNGQHGLDNDQAAQITYIKRKFLLRPLREDHPAFDGSNPLSTYSSTGLEAALENNALINIKGDSDNDGNDAGDDDDEITFPFWEAVGPWDVDNDGDGVNDSIWVDIGLPVQQTEDGRWYKPLVAMLVEDLDGRLNLNAHGSESDLVTEQLDRSNNGGSPLNFVFSNLAQDFNRAVPTLFSSDQLAQGSGWGTAEVSLRSVLSPTLPLDEALTGLALPNAPPYNVGFTGNPQYDDYSRLLLGRPAPNVASRVTARALNVSVPFGRYGSQLGLSVSAVANAQPNQSYLATPGRTFLATRPALRDVRTPLELLGYPRYTDVVPEEPSGFSSPHDLRSRYATGLSTVGAAVDEPTYAASQAAGNPPGTTWRELPQSAPDDAPYELDLSVAARKLPPVGVDAILRSYDADLDGTLDSNPDPAPLSDDAPFSPAELERLLRALDADADKLPGRLWEVVDAFDPTKLAAQRRVNNAVRNNGTPDVDQGNPNTLENAVASALAAINRRLVTTDSFDLPVPNENWTDRIALGADGRPGVPEFETIGDWVPTNNTLSSNDDGDSGVGEPGVDDDGDGTPDEADEVFMIDEGDEAVVGYDAITQSHLFSNGVSQTYDDLFNAGCDDYVVVMRQDPPPNARLTDFLRYRIVLELLRKGTIDFADITDFRPEVERQVSEILFGADRQALYARNRDTTTDGIDELPVNMVIRSRQPLISYGGLVAPEVLAGQRMDLNRPFGDGKDNNGNGVVDEPQEAGEPFVDSDNDGQITAAEYQDLDRDGQFYGDVDGDGIFYVDNSGDGAFDGFDPDDIDSDGDTVVDSLLVDHLWYDTNGDGFENVGEVRPFDHVGSVDANGRGAYVTTNNARRVHDDSRMARQLFARHLYCLMLALVDENYLAPYDSDDPQVLHYLDPLSGGFAGKNNPTPESSEAYRIANDLFFITFRTQINNASIIHDHTQVLATPAEENLRLLLINRARQIAQRKLTRRTIAQWAINVVDFRDPDSIQTPFEYDENPWDGWNVVDRVNGNAVYPIDGDLTTDENLSLYREVRAGGISDPLYTAPDPTSAARWMQRLDWTRGVVWGAERPEVLLTEGVAWHDRRLQDLGSDGDDDGGKLSNDDDDLDQLRKPKGSAFLELYNPWIGDDQRPAELYSHVDRFGNSTPGEPGVRLDRLSDRPQDPGRPSLTRSPVWRIACVEEHPLIRNATVSEATKGSLGGPIGLSLDDPATLSGSEDTTSPFGKPATESYLGVTLDGGPWAYATDGPGRVVAGTTTAIDVLPNAYLQFHQRKKTESAFALLTAGGYATGIGYNGGDFPTAPRAQDADGLLVPFGVIESPPTVPDTSFPNFDRFAQPFEPITTKLQISSTTDGNPEKIGTGEDEETISTINRSVSRKPTTYIERAFYMAAALPAVLPTAIDAPATERPTPGLLVPDPDGFNPDVGNGPGLHVPRLVYAVKAVLKSAGAKGNLLQYGPAVGVDPFGGDTGDPPITVGGDSDETTALIVHASKFAAAYDRFNLDGDTYPDTAAPLLIGQPNVTDVIEVAPLLPGRRAIVGSAGDIYDDKGSGVRNPTFNQDDARRLADRYTTLASNTAASAAEPEPFPVPGAAIAQAEIRRIEMIPDADENRHQFIVRLNGLNESLSVLESGQAFNLTSLEANNRNTGTSVTSAGSPVVAIPIQHFSISEPLDEYLVRQIELDPGLAKFPRLSFLNGGDRVLPEEYFSSVDSSADLRPFDEPFDIAPELVENQTTPNYRSLHLERLANPLSPWNPHPARPDGTPNSQHRTDLPVNPYLPVDARSLDLTAFNSYSDLESRVDAAGKNRDFVTPNTGQQGPEARHRRKRSLRGSTGALSAARETAIGFVSNERGRPFGPFPALWFAQPTRLLWRQAGPSTFTEIAHRYNAAERNGYLAEAIDEVIGDPLQPGGSIGDAGTRYDEVELGTSYNRLQFVDVPWRWTLGFGDWMNGKFFFGSGLTWFDASPSPVPVEDVDTDGNLIAGDLLGHPQISDDPTVTNPYTDNFDDGGNLLPNGRPDLIDNSPLGGKPNARLFFEQYLNTLSHDNSTTPELSWPNRPFASSGELLQVPVWGGSRMLTHFSVFNWLHTLNPHFSHRTQVNPYNGESAVGHDGLDYDPGTAARSTDPFTFDGNFGNDFDYLDANGDNIDDNANRQIADFDGQPEDGSTNKLRFRETLGHFGHLINFFQTARFPSFVGAFTRTTGIGEDAVPATDDDEIEDYVVPRGASHFYRLMDYVHVPSRFTATDTLLSPAVFAESGLPIGDARTGLSAPFNRVDSYREPGRVNLNTIVGRRDATEPTRLNLVDGSDLGATAPRLPDYWSEVYDGMMQRAQDGSLVDYGNASLLKQGHLGPAWRDVALSRRGYVQSGFDPTQDPGDTSLGLGSARQNQVDYSPRRMNPDFPTLFANPFRAPGEGANVPLDHMVQTGVDATLLRAHPLSPGADGAWGRRGADDPVVDKSGDSIADIDGNRDDANEAGVLPLELGIDALAGLPASPVSDRISADVVLARFSDEGADRRGALPDTFLDDAFRDVRVDGASLPGINPRSVSAAESVSGGIYNAEISKRATPVALFSGASLEPSLDTERNPTLRYLPIQRMSSLATTRSNVYAAWITVGFFEVKQVTEATHPAIWDRYQLDQPVVANPTSPAETQIAQLRELFNKVYPGGWTLGQEIGLDTGEDRRHRGFYMIDRSRPVAFKPGEDANVSKAILLRRRIE